MKAEKNGLCLRYMGIIILGFIASTQACLPSQKTITLLDPNPTPTAEKIADTFSRVFSKTPLKAVILNFTYSDGKSHRAGRYIAEKITTSVIKKGGLKVLDRVSYEKILQENGLSIESNLEPPALKKIGDLLKLDAVVVGTIHLTQAGYDVNARVIDAKNGMILAAEEGLFNEILE